MNLDHSRFYVEKRMELLGSWIDTASNYYLFEGYGKQADFGLTAYVKDNKCSTDEPLEDSKGVFLRHLKI